MDSQNISVGNMLHFIDKEFRPARRDFLSFLLQVKLWSLFPSQQSGKLLTTWKEDYFEESC